MGSTEATAKTSVYRPRNSHSSPLYRCVRQHNEELAISGVVHRRVEEQVLNRFIDCGDLHKGFARIYCDDCNHDYLLTFSCKTRMTCMNALMPWAHGCAGMAFYPNCYQKRMLAYGDWVEKEVFLPVPHLQYVFIFFCKTYRIGENIWCATAVKLMQPYGLTLTQTIQILNPSNMPVVPGQG